MRALAFVALSALGVVAAPGQAHADAAGPTDYRSEIVAVEPPTPGVGMTVLGGDAFLELTVQPGNDVLVTGYQHEPFVHIAPDGTVQVNERSPSLYLSESRSGTSPVPDHADPALPPAWKTVSSSGRYAWHDHRAHWMAAVPPADAVAGTQVQEGLVPLTVNGAAVTVRVRTVLLGPPSRVPLYAGAVAGLAAVAAALVVRRRLVWPLIAGAAAATGIGWWQFSSLPTETGPRPVWWVLPAVAVASGIAAVVLGRRLVSYALMVLGGLELIVWAYVRRGGVWRAYIPTDAPGWLDRAVLAGAAVVAVAAVIGGVTGLYRASGSD